MEFDECLECDDLGRMLDFLRGHTDPLLARRFGCACVRNVWNKVTAQLYVSDELIAHVCRAVALTERSLAKTVAEADLRAIDFTAITDAGDSAFMAAAHVGWNLFAPVNGLPSIDEFEHMKEIALLAACAGGPSEQQRQLDLLRKLARGSRRFPPDR